jgi:hypothetical protein
MSQHSGPHFNVVANDLRCEAMVAGIPSYHWEWQRLDHRCPRRANQSRAGRLVCYQHGAAKKVQWHNGGTSVAETPQDRSGRKKLLETIDATPTWVSLIPALVSMVRDGSAETQTIGVEQLIRMAKAADAYREMSKAPWPPKQCSDDTEPHDTLSALFE